MQEGTPCSTCQPEGVCWTNNALEPPNSSPMVEYNLNGSQVTRAEISCAIEALGGQARDDIDDDAILLHYYLLKNIQLNKGT